MVYPKKMKFASSEAKHRFMNLQDDWKAIQQKWNVDADERKRSRAMKAEPLVYSLDVPAGRSTKHIPSRDTGHSGPVSSKQPQFYTGTKMLGISQTHKSNSVPVFSDDAIIDIAHMRR
jgi:hypothetical protein